MLNQRFSMNGFSLSKRTVCIHLRKESFPNFAYDSEGIQAN